VQLQSSEIRDDLTAEYSATLKQPLKLGGYPDTESLHIRVSAYPLCHYVSAYLCIHLVNVFSIIVTVYPRIHFDIHLRQRKKHTVCVFVVLKATEGRKAHKRDNCISTKLNAGLALQQRADLL